MQEKLTIKAKEKEPKQRFGVKTVEADGNKEDKKQIYIEDIDEIL